ncbi:MAG TPA: ParA family protein [Syntrophales bacterium]|nr:ParA family protein [Syntrophales bacterium]
MKKSDKRIIALCNQKGGVGKTTCAVNIGAGLAALGRRVMLVDVDPQAHLTYALGVPAHDLKQSLYDVLKGGLPLEEAALGRDGMLLVPSSLDLAGLEMELASVPGRELLLRETLDGVEGYDFIILDCPPSLGLLTLNALCAAREVFIPLQTEFMALKGMGKLLGTIETVKKRLNPDLAVTGIIGTRYDARKRLNRGIVETITDRFGGLLFATLIRENVSLAEAPGYGQTIFEYAPRSYGAQDFRALAREIAAGVRS